MKLQNLKKNRKSIQKLLREKLESIDSRDKGLTSGIF